LNDYIGEKVIIYGFGTQIIQITSVIEITKYSIDLIHRLLNVTCYDELVSINIDTLIKNIKQESFYFVNFNEIKNTIKFIFIK